MRGLLHCCSSLLIGLIVSLALSGCSANESPTQSGASDGTAKKNSTDSASGAATTTDDSAVDEIELALNWLPEAEHGGFYAAELHGFFAAQKLKVKIISGGPGVPVIQNVASGKVLFGVANADQVLLGRAQEADVVAVLAPLQQSPRCIMVHKKSGVTKFDDLKNMTLAINPNQTFLGFLKKRQPLADVRVIPYTGSVAPFLQDERMGQQAYVFSEPFVAQKQGAEPINLMVSDLGFSPYTSVLLTRAEVIATQPDLVRRVVAASVLGWRKYLDEPAETNAHIHSLNQQMGLDILQFGASTIKPLCEKGLSSPERLGEMTLDRWKTLADQLVEGDALKPSSVDPAKAFDASFLPN